MPSQPSTGPWSALDHRRMHAVSPDTTHVVTTISELAQKRLLRHENPIGSSPTGNELKAQPIPPINEGGHDVEHVVEYVERVLLPACIAADSPGYLSFIPAAPTKASTAFDMYVTASSIFGGFWAAGAGAINAENEALGWLATEFGLPAGAGGTFVQGGTLGNLSALVTARDHMRRQLAERGVDLPRRWVILCNAEAHSSITSAARVMDVDVVRLAPDAQGVLRGETVRRGLEDHGSSVFCVVATAGSTNFGSVDDVRSIADLRPEHDFWLHVDGAYGLAGMLSDLTRDLFDGVAAADSLIVDPHKWLFAPLDACALIYRHHEHGRLAHTQRATYLETVHDDPDPSPADYAAHLTRRVRGLPLWFSLTLHGATAYRRAVTATVQCAREVAREVLRRPGLRLLRQPQLSIVAFERIGWSKADYDRWSESLLTEHQAFVRPSSHEGRAFLRFAIINPLITVEQLAGILDTLSPVVDDADEVAPDEREDQLVGVGV